MKLTISQEAKAGANKAKITDTLLKRLQDIVDDENELDTEKANAKQALRYLTHLKQRDEAARARINPDQDGWYNALYVRPEEGETVEIEIDGMVYRANFDGILWWPRPIGENTEPKVLIKKWRLIE